MSTQRKRVEMEHKTGRSPEGQERYGVGKSTLRKIAEEAGAVIHFGKTTIYHFGKIDDYLEGLAGGADGNHSE